MPRPASGENSRLIKRFLAGRPYPEALVHPLILFRRGARAFFHHRIDRRGGRLEAAMADLRRCAGQREAKSTAAARTRFRQCIVIVGGSRTEETAIAIKTAMPQSSEAWKLIGNAVTASSTFLSPKRHAWAETCYTEAKRLEN